MPVIDRVTQGFGNDYVYIPAVAAPQPPAGTLRGGCDPGKNGWIVVERADGSLAPFPIPTTEENDYDEPALLALAQKLRRMGVGHVTLEAQQPVRLRGSQHGAANNAVRASFMTGYGYALLRMAFLAAGIQIDTAWPSAWKKKMGLTPDKGLPEKDKERERKQLARTAGETAWPKHDFRPTPRCRVSSHDQCEAALLIRYGQMKGFGCH